MMFFQTVLKSSNYDWVIPEKIHTPPTDGKLEILAGGGVDSSGNPGGRGDLNRKILPRGSLLTLTSIDIFQPLLMLEGETRVPVRLPTHKGNRI